MSVDVVSSPIFILQSDQMFSFLPLVSLPINIYIVRPVTLMINIKKYVFVGFDWDQYIHLFLNNLPKHIKCLGCFSDLFYQSSNFFHLSNHMWSSNESWSHQYFSDGVYGSDGLCPTIRWSESRDNGDDIVFGEWCVKKNHKEGHPCMSVDS